MIKKFCRALIDYMYTGETVKKKRIALKNSIVFDSIPKTECHNSIYVDVSIIAQCDERTGIQRVVRALLNELQKNPPPGYKVCPVFATRNQCYQHVHREFSIANSGISSYSGETNLITPSAGDIFFGLDLATSILPEHYNQLESWKQNGMKIHI